MTNYFFNCTLYVINSLRRYAPNDNDLLKIPTQVNIINPICLPQGGISLMSYLQKVNQKLSMVYATHAYIIKTKDSIRPNNLSQTEIDNIVFLEGEIILEHYFSIRSFILSLKVSVDQLIALLRLTYKTGKIASNINDFLNNFKSHPLMASEKFLLGLNISANYIKHNDFQFTDHFQLFNKEAAAICVFVKSDGYKSFRRMYANNLSGFECKNEAGYWIYCSFLVDEFNIFYSQYIENITTRD